MLSESGMFNIQWICYFILKVSTVQHRYTQKQIKRLVQFVHNSLNLPLEILGSFFNGRVEHNKLTWNCSFWDTFKHLTAWGVHSRCWICYNWTIYKQRWQLGKQSSRSIRFLSQQCLTHWMLHGAWCQRVTLPKEGQLAYEKSSATLGHLAVLLDIFNRHCKWAFYSCHTLNELVITGCIL